MPAPAASDKRASRLNRLLTRNRNANIAHVVERRGKPIGHRIADPLALDRARRESQRHEDPREAPTQGCVGREWREGGAGLRCENDGRPRDNPLARKRAGEAEFDVAALRDYLKTNIAELETMEGFEQLVHDLKEVEAKVGSRFGSRGL